jgi:hypothetical protein
MQEAIAGSLIIHKHHRLLVIMLLLLLLLPLLLVLPLLPLLPDQRDRRRVVGHYVVPQPYGVLPHVLLAWCKRGEGGRGRVRERARAAFDKAD